MSSHPSKYGLLFCQPLSTYILYLTCHLFTLLKSTMLFLSTILSGTANGRAINSVNSMLSEELLQYFSNLSKYTVAQMICLAMFHFHGAQQLPVIHLKVQMWCRHLHRNQKELVAVINKGRTFFWLWTRRKCNINRNTTFFVYNSSRKNIIWSVLNVGAIIFLQILHANYY